MKLRIVLFAYLILPLTFEGISQTTIEKLPIVKISHGFTNAQKINLSRIAGSVRYVKLETTKESFISAVSKAIFTVDQDGGPGFWPLGRINDRVLYSAVNLEDAGNPVLMIVEMK